LQRLRGLLEDDIDERRGDGEVGAVLYRYMASNGLDGASNILNNG